MAGILAESWEELMKPYPSTVSESLSSVTDVVQFIVRERDVDIRDWNNLNNIYISGRKVGKIPTSSVDIVPEDRVGDVSYDVSYFYIVVNNGGTAEWRRIALGVW
jgi:hypothetical protein